MAVNNERNIFDTIEYVYKKSPAAIVDGAVIATAIKTVEVVNAAQAANPNYMQSAMDAASQLFRALGQN